MKDLIQSKKFRTMAIGILAVIAVKIAALKGIVLDADTASYIANTIVALASAYILAQGGADFGKSGKLILAGAMDVAKAVSADTGASEAPKATEEPPKPDGAPAKADEASEDAQ